MIFMNKVFQVTNNNCVALLDPLLMIMNPLNFWLRLLNAICSHDQVVEFEVFYHQLKVFYHQLIDRQLLS